MPGLFLFLFIYFKVLFWLTGRHVFVCFENLYMLQVTFCILDLLVSWILFLKILLLNVGSFVKVMFFASYTTGLLWIFEKK